MAKAPDVLAVDDEPLVLNALRRTLADLDVVVETTTDPHAVLERLAGAPPRVLISDFSMPAVDGVTVLREARRLAPDTVRILLTARAEQGDIVDAINEGRIFRFVAKPWSNEDLVAVVREALRAHELAAAGDSLDARQERESLRAAVAGVRAIQRATLPDGDAAPPGAELACFATPYEHASGDCVDVLALGPGRIGLLVGDVAGHGLEAALFGFAARALLRSALLEGAPLADALDRTNRALCRDFTEGRFLTLFAAFHDARRRRLTYVNAGHLPPFLLDGEGVRPLPRTALPLGLLPDLALRDAVKTIPFPPGATLFAYTDGLTEARDAASEFFGLDRLREHLARCRGMAVQGQIRHVRDLLAGFVGDARAQDDLTLLAYRAAATVPAPRPAAHPR